MDYFKKNSSSNPVEAYTLSLNSLLSAKQAKISLEIFCEFLFETRDFNKCNWSNIDYIAILRFMRELDSKSRAHTTINTYLTFIKGVAAECWKQEIISLENYIRIKSIKCRKGVRRVAGRALEPYEIKKLKTFFSQSKTNKSTRDCAIFALACCAGLRREEISKLNIEDITGNGVIVSGKGNKTRLVHLFGYVKTITNNLILKSQQKKGALFTHIDRADNFNHKRLSVHGVHYSIMTLRDNVKIKHFTMHDLRRTFATTLLDVGADRFAVQRLMGHSSLVTTELYDRRGEKSQIEAIKLLPYL